MLVLGLPAFMRRVFEQDDGYGFQVGKPPPPVTKNPVIVVVLIFLAIAGFAWWGAQGPGSGPVEECGTGITAWEC